MHETIDLERVQGRDLKTGQPVVDVEAWLSSAQATRVEATRLAARIVESHYEPRHRRSGPTVR